MGPRAVIPRAVLDTNVVISALVFEGALARIRNGWKNSRFRFLLSAAVLDEYTRALAYPKFRLTAGEIRSLIADEILPFITAVKPRGIRKVVVDDPDDDKFLACAHWGKADFLVSGDLHLLALKHYGPTVILKPATFLEGLPS